MGKRIFGKEWANPSKQQQSTVRTLWFFSGVVGGRFNDPVLRCDSSTLEEALRERPATEADLNLLDGGFLSLALPL